MIHMRLFENQHPRYINLAMFILYMMADRLIDRLSSFRNSFYYFVQKKTTLNL